MKPLKKYINEKLDVSKDYSGYNYQPKDKYELQSLMEQLIEERGGNGDFNDIDTSLITDMSYLFYKNKTFNGDISSWDTSNVTDMHWMFAYTESFNQSIGRWNTSKVTDIGYMFYKAKSFNQNISNWNVKKVKYNKDIFRNCPIKDSYKPKFK